MSIAMRRIGSNALVVVVVLWGGLLGGASASVLMIARQSALNALGPSPLREKSSTAS